MNLNSVLAQLNNNSIGIYRDTTDDEGWRTIIVGCAAPSPPYGLGHILYYTLVLSPGQTDVPIEERDALRRRLWHSTTDLFGDDEAIRAELDAINIDDMLVGAPAPPSDPDPE